MRGPILPAKSAEVYSSSRFLVKALMDNLMDNLSVFFCFFLFFLTSPFFIKRLFASSWQVVMRCWLGMLTSETHPLDSKSAEI